MDDIIEPEDEEDYHMVNASQEMSTRENTDPQETDFDFHIDTSN